MKEKFRVFSITQKLSFNCYNQNDAFLHVFQRENLIDDVVIKTTKKRNIKNQRNYIKMFERFLLYLSK